MNKSFLTLLACLGFQAAGCALQPRVPDADLVLSGGTVYNGADAAGQVADVWIRDGRIVFVGDPVPVEAGLVLDVTGLVVAPGFIDIHSHAIRDSRPSSGLQTHPDAENYIRQGVTTIIGGPDGGSRWPIAGLLAELEAAPPAVNFGTFVGHNTVRETVMGREARAPTPEELEDMKGMVDRGMREGAFGLSTGLKYIPGAYSETWEVIELARVAGRHGGIHISHMREEGLDLLASVAETIRIGEEGGLPTQLTHHKVVGQPMWGASDRTLAMVEDALARGVDVSIDQYPYTASSTGISVLYPRWGLAGDEQEQLARLRDPETRAKIKAAIVENIINDRGGNDPARVALANCRWNPSLNGKNLAEVLEERGQAPTIGAAAELVMELQASGGCFGVFHAMAEEDVIRIMGHPRTMIASDGGIFVPGEGVPHPRNYGAFARVLGKYVRDEGVLPLHTAIHKMTLMPAERIGLPERGRIAKGAVADIAVFDPDAIRDTATFEDPHRYAEGMIHVFVAGEAVLLNGEMTGTRPGKVLRSGGAPEETEQ